ncbi:hypothetical protein E4U26_006462 [Claviceps purpurea]|nr:hypothetical protein E4U26_006462 [Claviceps purpurea]
MKDTFQFNLGLVPEHLGRCDTLPAAKGSASQLHGIELFMANAVAFIENLLTFEKGSKALLQEGFGENREMRTKFRVRDLNNSRRMQNDIVVDEDEPLDILYSMRTGQLIPDFPKNLRALDALPAQCMDAILIELEHSVEGRLLDRRRRLDHALDHSLALAAEHVRRCSTLPAVDIEPLANQLAPAKLSASRAKFGRAKGKTGRVCTAPSHVFGGEGQAMIYLPLGQSLAEPRARLRPS